MLMYIIYMYVCMLHRVFICVTDVSMYAQMLAGLHHNSWVAGLGLLESEGGEGGTSKLFWVNCVECRNVR